jgi:muconolactone delta-isomerase
LSEHRASGELKEVWNFARLSGGGGALEADNHEELEEIMGGSPWTPWSTMEIYPLSDLDRSLATNRASFQRMMGSSP